MVEEEEDDDGEEEDVGNQDWIARGEPENFVP